MAEFPMKILLATDGSRFSDAAMRTAVDLAEKTGSELHVVYVGILSHWMVPDTLNAPQYARLREEAQKILEQQVEKVRGIGGSAAEAHLRMGRRADEQIIDLAEELGADMIVVGSRGAGTLSRAFLGSDADSIVRHAHCPVLVVREKGEVTQPA